MKRLLCITGSLGCGGAETFLMKIYRSIDRDKYQFDFCISIGADDYYENEIVGLGGNVYRIEAKTKNPLKFKKDLYKLIRLNSYEYVLRITSSAVGFWDLKIAKQAGARICCVRSSNSSDGTGFIVNLLHVIGRKLFAKYIDVAIAPSDLAAIYTFGEKAYKQGDVKLLNNAIDLDVYSFNKINRDEIRKQLGISQNEIVIGHIGRFTKQKNHDFLLDVFYEMKKMNDNIRLILVGDGLLEVSIKDKAQKLNINEKIIFTGIRSDIPQLLSAMDVFLLPSLYEGMPNTVIEAQAVGIPCVISDTITNKVDITGLVEFLSLQLVPERWAEKTLNKIGQARMNTKNLFIEQGYDIDSTVEHFIKLIFD